MADATDTAILIVQDSLEKEKNEYDVVSGLPPNRLLYLYKKVVTTFWTINGWCHRYDGGYIFDKNTCLVNMLTYQWTLFR